MVVNLDKLQYIEIPKVRKNFYASDFNKPDLDLYFGWMGEPKTNPPKWYDTLRWGAGIGVEDKMLDILKMNGIVEEDYDQNVHGGFKVEREGIFVSGRNDARTKSGEPIEIKSVNNKNSKDISNYRNGYPKENYVGQLAIYLDALDKEQGYLFASTIDGMDRFWFVCKKIGPGKYRCGKVEVDVYAEYRRWAKLYNEHVIPQVIPNVFEYLYKYPVDEIDWTQVPKYKIAAARGNKAVVGDWQLTYSDWKDKIIKLQGTTFGYTNEELALIQEKTKGYTTWGKKVKKAKTSK